MGKDHIQTPNEPCFHAMTAIDAYVRLDFALSGDYLGNIQPEPQRDELQHGPSNLAQYRKSRFCSII